MTAVTPAVGDSWGTSVPHRWPARPDWGAWSDRRQQLPAAILGEVVDDLVQLRVSF
jgi:hypothetical protein